jgi:type IV pilus assembly protein PilC
MLFSKQIPLQSLVDHCRALRHMLEAGLTLAQAMKQQAKKGPFAVRPVAERMAKKLAKGEDFKSVLKEEMDYFPPLFLALGTVAEETGNLPEVLRELEQYFELQIELWRTFWRMIAWPMIQFVAAILVLGLLILLLGWIESVSGPNQFSVFGLKGEKGAMIWITFWVVLVVGLGGGYFFARNVLKRGAMIDGFLLGIPLLGTTIRNFALSRFSMGLALAMEAGVPIREAARLSLLATSNHAFIARTERVENYIQEGHTLTDALHETGMFPQTYLMSVETAEIGGREPEVLQKQAKNLHEEGVRGLRRLCRIAGGAVWLLVAAFIIFFIFSLVMQVSGIYSKAFKDAGID